MGVARAFGGLSLVLGAIFATGVSPATAQEDRTLLVSGYGPIVGGDQASARTRAIADAFQRAVEQVLGTLVEARTFIKNELLIRSEVYSRASGYLRTYEILSEGPDQGQYRVTMRVVVATAPLQNDLVRLGLIQLVVDNPRIMVLYDPGASVPEMALFAEQELLRHLTEKQFTVVDPATSRRLHREAAELLKVNPVENVAARLGLEHNAEVVLLYRLEVEPRGADGVFEQARAMILARAIVTTTAQILTTVTRTGAGAGQSRREAAIASVTRASGEAADYTMQRITAWWTSYVLNGIPYTVALESLPGQGVDSRFGNRLGTLTGMAGVHLRACGGGFCEAQVTYKGSTARLQQAIMEAFQGEPGFERLAIKSIRGTNLTFTVK